VEATGWRYGEFHIFTDDDSEPVLKPGVDLYDCGYRCETIQTFDGWWSDYEYDGCDDDTIDWLEDFFEDGGIVWELISSGWVEGKSQMIVSSTLTIERVNDDSEDADP
jgi:hypothetical protein